MDCCLSYQKGEFIFKSGCLEVTAPAPCMGDFSMPLLIQAIETNTIYRTGTTAQVSVFISAKNGQARYAWSFGDHTPCGSAISLPLALLLTALYDLVNQNQSSFNFAMPQWLQCGIDPNMKCFAPSSSNSSSPSLSLSLSSSSSFATASVSSSWA